jgi:hypothetical protein
MPKEKFMYQCFMCGREYQYGPHKYEGREISRYKINVCNVCYDANRDGWSPEYQEKLIAHLKKEGIGIPARNREGWLPRE